MQDAGAEEGRLHGVRALARQAQLGEVAHLLLRLGRLLVLGVVDDESSGRCGQKGSR